MRGPPRMDAVTCQECSLNASGPSYCGGLWTAVQEEFSFLVSAENEYLGISFDYDVTASLAVETQSNRWRPWVEIWAIPSQPLPSIDSEIGKLLETTSQGQQQQQPQTTSQGQQVQLVQQQQVAWRSEYLVFAPSAQRRVRFRFRSNSTMSGFDPISRAVLKQGVRCRAVLWAFLCRTKTQRGRLWMTRMRRGVGSKDRETTPATTSTTPSAPTTGLCERGNDTTRNTGRSGRQKAATRRSTRREERVTVQDPVKKQQPDGMSQKWGGCSLISRLSPCFILRTRQSFERAANRVQDWEKSVGLPSMLRRAHDG